MGGIIVEEWARRRWNRDGKHSSWCFPDVALLTKPRMYTTGQCVNLTLFNNAYVIDTHTRETPSSTAACRLRQLNVVLT